MIDSLDSLHLPSLYSSLLRVDAKSSLSSFIHQSWPIIEPDTSLDWNWHLDELCDILERVKRGEIKRLIINIPPGFSKSLFVSVFFSAYLWSTNPSLRFLTAAYSDDNTIRDNLRLRDLVKSDWYRSNFPNVILSSDQSAKIRFNTTAGGWRIASSVGGTGTGEHPDYIIIDDPLKAKDRSSEVKRKEAIDWIKSTISTRVRRNPAIILVMQRLHVDDPAGYLQSLGGWERFCLPMHYQPTKFDPKTGQVLWLADPRDRRSQPGELLWPEVFDEEVIEKMSVLLGPFGVAAQLEQDPTHEGAGLFNRDKVEFVDTSPIEAERCRGWDIAESEDSGDWTVGVKLARVESGTIYVEHVVRDRKTLVDDLIKSIAITDGKKCSIREGAGSGKATIKNRSILLAGWDYDKSPESDSKVQRANPFRSQWEAGNVKIIRGDWNEAYLDVMCAFPVGRYDDDVDGSSNAFNCLVEGIGEVDRSWATFGKYGRNRKKG